MVMFPGGNNMPVHAWTRVDAGLFHDFHQTWTVTLRSALNAGGLPPDYFALVEQRISGPIADVLTLKLADGGAESRGPSSGSVGLAVGTVPPPAQVILRKEAEIYASKANRITVRHRHGDVVAVIEIVSPGNKGNQSDFRAFIEKSADLLRHGIHLLLIDLFPPGPRDPQGIPNALWDHIGGEEFELPPDKCLTVAAYDAGPMQAAYVNYLTVGDPLPSAPLFLEPGFYVPAPLETTYQTAWETFPAPLKRLLE
jgi:hypothetical protein